MVIDFVTREVRADSHATVAELRGNCLCAAACAGRVGSSGERGSLALDDCYDLAEVVEQASVALGKDFFWLLRDESPRSRARGLLRWGEGPPP
jgi:hypothetical protein